MASGVYTQGHTLHQTTAPQVTCGISQNQNFGLVYFLAGDAECFAYSTPGSYSFAVRILPKLEVLDIYISLQLCKRFGHHSELQDKFKGRFLACSHAPGGGQVRVIKVKQFHNIFKSCPFHAYKHSYESYL